MEGTTIMCVGFYEYASRERRCENFRACLFATSFNRILESSMADLISDGTLNLQRLAIGIIQLRNDSLVRRDHGLLSPAYHALNMKYPTFSGALPFPILRRRE